MKFLKKISTLPDPCLSSQFLPCVVLNAPINVMRIVGASLPGLLGPEFCNIFLISETLDKIESNSRLQSYIGDLRGIPPLGVAHTVCTLFTNASRVRSVSVALPQLSLFPLH